MKAAIIFHRLGPYHFARLCAAGRQLPVVAVETSGRDETYAWEKVAGADGFGRVTLFENADAQRQSKSEVARRMAVTLDKIQPRVVVVPGWADAAALAAIRWSMEQRIPVVCMSESTEWDSKRRVWSEELKRRVVGLCSAALVGGTPHKDYMVRLGMPAERIFLGYDAVDGEYFASEAQRARSEEQETRAKYGLPENYFLASARFIEKKNLPRLLKAFSRYRELSAKRQAESAKSEAESGKRKAESTSPRPSPQSGEGVALWDLVLLGDGELRPALTALRSALGLDACVHLPGFKQYPDLPAYYGCAKAFIHASTTEQWGLVVNEAMASGLPVLVSNRCGCAQDLVQEGVNGFTFDPHNVEEMAQLMLRISDFRFPISEFGDASRKIIANWGPERFASGLKAAVEKALAAGAAKASPIQRVILRSLMMK